jgi:hypothetical protein
MAPENQRSKTKGNRSMSDWTTTLAVWTARGAGAIAGSSVSLVYFLPKQRHEAVSRLIVGVLTGLVFGSSAGEKLVELMALEVHPAAFEVVLMGAAATSFASWWALGMVVRLLEQKGQAPDQKGTETNDEIKLVKDNAQ